MADPSRRSKTLRLLLLIFLLAVAAAAAVYSYTQSRLWIVPEAAKRVKNPLPLTPGALQSARALFGDQCVECHGDSGKGDGPQAKMYEPRPHDLTDSGHIATVTDGELFYRISEGHKPMPAYKNRLTEQQRWQLVLLIRSLSGTIPPEPPPAPLR